MPDKTSPYAEEGTKAHELLEKSILKCIPPMKIDFDFGEYDEKEMRKNVQVAYDYIAKGLENPNVMIFSETKVVYGEDCWGTVDILKIDGSDLEVIDLKYGQGKIVEPDTLQTLIYAAGAMRSYDWCLDAPPETVTRTIIQPRATHSKGPIRSITDPLSRVIELLKQDVIPPIKEILKGDTKFLPSVETCQWCKAGRDAKCDKFISKGMEAVNAAFTDEGLLEVPTKDEVKAYNVDKLVEIVKAEKMLSLVLNTAKARVEELILAGHDVPGLKMIEGSANRQFVFKTEDELIEFLTKTLKLKKTDCYTQKPLSPAQTEKLIDKNARNGKIKWEALQEHIVKPKGKPKLVDADHPAPSIAPMFKDETQEQDFLA